MLSTFGSIYFGNQYTLDVGTSVDLGEVISTSSTTIELYNASDEAVSSPITLLLEDGTFQLTWPGQTAVIDAAGLAAAPLVLEAHSSIVVTLTFLDAGRSSVQTVDFLWAGTSLTFDFQRYIVINNKPQGEVSEILQFKTNISEAWDGTEQRTRLRSNPRSSTSLSYLVGAGDRQEGREFQAQMMGLPSREAKVAMWHRTQQVELQFTSGGGFVPNTYHLALDGPSRWDATIGALQAGDSILFQDASGVLSTGNLTADATESGRLNFSVPFGTTGDKGTVVPQTIATMSESPSVSVYPSEAVGYRSKWISQQADYIGNNLDTSTLYASLAPETYNGRPILREGNQVNRSLSFSGDSGAVRFDRKIGIIDTFQRRETSIIEFDRIFDYKYEPGKIDALREFLMWTQGRQRSFYVPSGTQDFFAVSHDDTAKTLTIMGTQLGGLTPLLDGYASFEVTTSGGSKTQHTVLSSAANGDDTVTITYDGSMGSAATSTLKFELLYHVRMASDSLKLKYESRESAACKATVQTVKQ